MNRNTPTCENCPNAGRCPLLKHELYFRNKYCDRLIRGKFESLKPLSYVMYLKCFIEDREFKSLSLYKNEPFKKWLKDLRIAHPVHDN